MIMLFCLQDYYEYTGDPRVIALMTKYFHYLAGVPEEKFLVGYWPKLRGGDLLWSVYWLYNRTGDGFLLDLAQKVHRRTAEWTRDVIDWHNVNMSQGLRRADHLLAAIQGGQAPGGVVPQLRQNPRAIRPSARRHVRRRRELPARIRRPPPGRSRHAAWLK